MQGLLRSDNQRYLNNDTNNFNDQETPVPELQTNNTVQLRELDFNLSEDQVAHLNEAIDPMRDDGNHGITLFQETVNLLNSFGAV